MAHTISNLKRVCGAALEYATAMTLFVGLDVSVKETTVYVVDDTGSSAGGLATSVNSMTLAKDVVAFPFDQKALMGGISIPGSKITSYNPNA